MTTQQRNSMIHKLASEGMSKRNIARYLGVSYPTVYYQLNKENWGNHSSSRSRRSSGSSRIDFIDVDYDIENHQYGIEIECVNPRLTDRVTAAIEIEHHLHEAGFTNTSCTQESWHKNTRPHWRITTDASIGYDNFEIVSPILRGQNGLDQTKAVCKALQSLGCTIDKRCGLHVHVDASQWRHEDGNNIHAANIAYNYARLEGVISKALPQSRRGRCRYVARIRQRANHIDVILNTIIENYTTITVRDVAIAIGRDRYRTLNVRSYFQHGTVEFRHHSGTIEFEKIEQWVKFVTRLYDISKTHRISKSEKVTFNTLLGFAGRQAAEYWKSRKAKFERIDRQRREEAA